MAAVVKSVLFIFAHIQYPEIGWTATGLALLSLSLTAVKPQRSGMEVF